MKDDFRHQHLAAQFSGQWPRDQRPWPSESLLTAREHGSERTRVRERARAVGNTGLSRISERVL